MATFAINPTGLKVKPTYESQVGYIANQPRIVYPDRRATMLARSQQMATLFNENAAQMAEQQARAQQNQMIQQMVSGVAEGLRGKGFGKGTQTDPVSVSDPNVAVTRAGAQTIVTGPMMEEVNRQLHENLEARAQRLIERNHQQMSKKHKRIQG